MEAPRHITEYLRPREGWETEVYTDTEGHPTAGMGHLLNEAERHIYNVGDTVPGQVLESWTRADVSNAYAAARSQAAGLGLAADTAFVTVLTSVNFQLGTHWRGKFPQTWAAIRRGQWDKAAGMVEGSKWAAQTPTRAMEFSNALRAQARRGRRGRTSLKITVALALLLAAIAAANIESN